MGFITVPQACQGAGRSSLWQQSSMLYLGVNAFNVSAERESEIPLEGD